MALSETRNSHRQHKDWWTPQIDRWMFFVFFLLGSLFILILKALFESQVLVTVIPCFLMLIYTSLMWDFGRQQPCSDTAGDNLYYLGFLYTLTSLAHSLYRFSSDEADVEVIITNFGIAIFTTILGMALRVLMGRPASDDPFVLEESARLSLAEAARELRREMSYTVETFRERLEQDFEGVRQRLGLVVQQTQEANSETVKHIQSFSQTVTRLNDAVDKAVVSLVARAQELDQSAVDLIHFEESVQDLDSRTKEAIKTIELRSDAVSIGAEEICESLLAQAKQISGIDFLQALLDHAAKPASNELQSIVLQLKSLLDILRQIDLVRQQGLGNIDKVAAALHEAMSKQHKTADLILHTLKDSTVAAGSLRDVSEQWVRSVDGAREMAQGITAVNRELLESVERIRAVNRALANESKKGGAFRFLGRFRSRRR